MDVTNILKQADELFDAGKAKEASAYLEKCLETAGKEGDWYTRLTLLNELMGYYRSISNFDKAWEYVKEAIQIVITFQLEETLGGVTTYLNVANVYRAVGEPDKAIELYLKVEQTYLKEGLDADYRLGSLYNNISVAYIELGNLEEAFRYGEKALEMLKQIPGSADEQATAYSNLAGALMQSEEPDFEKVDQYLGLAVEIMENECQDSPHYCSILAMRAYVAYHRNDKKLALGLYEKAMKETERFYGKNIDYMRLERNYNTIKEELRQ